MLRLSLLLSAAALQSFPAFTQNANAETLRLDLIEVAGLQPVAAEDLTISVTVIDADDLTVRGAPYLADQLRAAPGIGVSRSGAAGGLTQVRIRGAEANHTLVLVDGIEVSDPITGETDFGLFAGLYPARVEVARGEQSALYGSDAIGGVVNIVTNQDPGARGILEGGSFGTWRLDGAYGFDFETADLQFAFSDVISDGVDTSGLRGEKDGYQNYSGLVTGGAKLPSNWSARGLFRYAYGEVDTDPDLNFDGRLDDADRVTESKQVTLGGSVSGDAFGLSHLFRASYNQVERENFGDGSSLTVADADRTKLAYSPSINLGQGAADILVSGLVDWESEDYTARDTEFGGFTNQNQSFETLGLTGEIQIIFVDLILNASARHDDNNARFDDASTWRAGAAYSFDFGGKLHASLGTGVKNPTFTELFGFFPGTFAGNSDLKPESSQSWEIGWDQTYDQGFWSLTYFEAELEDEIFTSFFIADPGDPNDPFDDIFFSTPENRNGKSERSGVEASMRYNLSDTLSFNGAVSKITSQNETGADEIRVPEWTGSIALNWTSESKDGLRVGIATDYVGEQLDTDFGTFQTVELDSYWLLSASADYPLTERISLTLRGENLLDETVTDVFGFNGPGAGVFIGLRLR